MLGVVGDFHEQLQRSHQRDRLGDDGTQTRVEEQRLCSCVGEQIGDFLGRVPVVDVERDGADLQGGEVALHELRAVVEQLPDARAGPDAVVEKGLGQPSGAVVELAPGPAGGTLHQDGPIRHGIGDRFPEGGGVHFHGSRSPRIRRTPFTRTKPVDQCRRWWVTTRVDPLHRTNGRALLGTRLAGHSRRTTHGVARPVRATPRDAGATSVRVARLRPTPHTRRTRR